MDNEVFVAAKNAGVMPRHLTTLANVSRITAMSWLKGRPVRLLRGIELAKALAKALHAKEIPAPPEYRGAELDNYIRQAIHKYLVRSS